MSLGATALIVCELTLVHMVWAGFNRSMTSEHRTKIAAQFIAALPHANALGLTLKEIGNGYATITMSYDERLVGDSETGMSTVARCQHCLILAVGLL